MLYATQRTPMLPNMGVFQYFASPLSQDELNAEAARIARNPYGLGRKLEKPIVLGARPLWRAHAEPPEVKIGAPIETAAEVAAWVADVVSRRLDPMHGDGWQIAAAPSNGGMYVIITMNHLYGTGRDIVYAVWGPDAYGPIEHVNGFDDDFRHDVRAESADLAGRVWLGVRGIGSLGAKVVNRNGANGSGSKPKDLRARFETFFDKDSSRGNPSARRVATSAVVEAEDWDAAAAQCRGSRVALLTAVTANLVREARRARGGDMHRPLRIIIPVDLADRSSGERADSTLGEIELTSANVMLPGGVAHHKDLKLERDVCRQAFAEARAEVARTGHIPVAPGMVDAMRLLPDAVTTRAVMKVHARFDGGASSMGQVFPEMGRIGDKNAAEFSLLAFPMGADISVTMSECEGNLGLGVVADPSRLGAGPRLSDRLASELEAWGLKASVR